MNYYTVKRTADIIIAVVLLILLFPLLVLISLAIFIQIKENPFFIQERSLSLGNKRFNIYKFKTLADNNNLFDVNNSSILFKPQKRKCLIKYGKFLRKTGLDELPQLINIIKGEMCFVGPRPLSIEDLNKIKINFPHLYRMMEKITIAPGVSGYWQISKDESGDINYLVKANRYYYKNISPLLDLKILFRSIVIMLTGGHIDSIVNTDSLSLLLASKYRIFLIQKAFVYISVIVCLFHI